MKTIFTIIMLLPLVAFSQSLYFTAFGQMTIPTSEFSEKSTTTDATIKSGYGGGVDFNIHFSESVIWMTSITFSENAFRGLRKIDDKTMALKGSYAFYTLPFVTGIAYERKVGKINIAIAGQLGMAFAEYPSISGTTFEETGYDGPFDSQIDGSFNPGHSVCIRSTFNRFAISLRYMDFGDYTFKGVYSPKHANKDFDTEFKRSISFFMLSFGYNIDLTGDE